MKIPSPFKGALFLRITKENENKIKKQEKIPSVVTSIQWQK